MTEWVWPASVVTRVVDADTFTARLTRDLGFNGTVVFQQRLRLNRINAPAKSSMAGKAAMDAAALLLNSGAVTITTVGPYKYGDEWMAEVEIVGGKNVSDVLVDMGHAVYWDGRGPRPADS